MNVLKDRQREIENQKMSYQQNIPRNYHNADDVNQAIKEKKRKYETTSLTSQEEKRLLKEIENLQKSLPDMAKLSELEPELKKIKDEKRKIQAELDVVKKVIDVGIAPAVNGKCIRAATQKSIASAASACQRILGQR